MISESLAALSAGDNISVCTLSESGIDHCAYK